MFSKETKDAKEVNINNRIPAIPVTGVLTSTGFYYKQMGNYILGMSWKGGF